MRLSSAIVVFVALTCTVSAQWRYRDPTAPRTADGKVDVKAPPPRTASGTVDLSGIWQTDIKYNFNLGADLKPDDIVMLPERRRSLQHVEITTAKMIRKASACRQDSRA
jgi:hypothetical protein